VGNNREKGFEPSNRQAPMVKGRGETRKAKTAVPKRSAEGVPAKQTGQEGSSKRKENLTHSQRRN